MKRLTRHIVLLALIFLIQPAFAQSEGFKCPWDEVDCPGKCGRYFDADGDGFCDYGRISKVIKVDTVAVKDTGSSIKNAGNHSVSGVHSGNNNDGSSHPDTIQSDTTATAEKSVTESKPVTARSYSLLLICLLSFGFYGLTSFLYEMKLYRKFVHRRIWNVLLLITFLTTAILGIILVVQINYNISSSLIRDYLYWHVQFGIAMTVIALIHILWHWKYFVHLFSKKSKSDCIKS